MIRVGALDDAYNLALGQMIHLADEVVGLFVLHRKAFQAPDVTDDDLAGGTGGLDRDVEHRLHWDVPRDGL